MGFESMPTTPKVEKMDPQEAAQARERFIGEARAKIQYWEGAISEYRAQLGEYKANGDKESVTGMESLIREAEAEKAKEESKIMSKI